ncbi:MAG TPA: hypothetical protein VK978_03980 [Candidatus Saccharimonadales bacterium]|nr:hypothetical protein [Candidatus Saccharimonadales bacterium]
MLYQEQLTEIIEHISRQATKLYFEVVGDISGCVIEHVVVFCHSAAEYEQLQETLRNLGQQADKSNGISYILEKPVIVIGGTVNYNGQDKTVQHAITRIDLRLADTTIGLAGYAYYKFEKDGGWDYWEFKDHYGMYTLNPKTIQREGYEMLEFFDPDSDVLGYMSSKVD